MEMNNDKQMPGMDHSKMDHSKMDHSKHDMNAPMGMAGHDHHAMMIEDFKKRFWISLVITVPILALSAMIQLFFGFTLSFSGDKYVLFGLSSFIFFYGGYPFLKGLISEVKAKNPGMMTLIAMAITVAYLYSTATVFGLRGMDFFVGNAIRSSCGLRIGVSDHDLDQ